MTDTKVPPEKAASDLVRGDRIAAGTMPGTQTAVAVLFVFPYTNRRGEDWMFVVFREANYGPESSTLRADARVPVEPAAPLAGVVQVADGHVVHECCGKLDDGPHHNFCAAYVRPAAAVEHYEKRGWKGEGPGSCGVECACGLGYDGFDSLAQASELLAVHIAASVAPSEPAEPVTWHFSFGHGQTDPDTGENLLGKYVTVVAPSYEACRTAMLASRYGNRWSFDYDPDGAAWREWGPRWIEHERIDATGPKPDPMGVVEGDTAAEQYDNAAARYERDA